MKLINKKDIKFMRPDGTMTKYAVGYIINSTTGEIMYFELLGASGFDGIPSLKIRGKEKYRRLMIRRCYPVIDNIQSLTVFEEGIKCKNEEGCL